MSNVVEVFMEKALRIGRAVAKRPYLAAGVSVGMAVITLAAVSQVHNRYEATAQVYVDTDKVLKPLMAGLTFQPDIDQQVRMLARTLISRDNVERLLSMPELQSQLSTGQDRDELIGRLMDQIHVMPTASGNLYEISYRGTRPEVARKLVEATVNMFMHAGIGAKKRDSENAGRFIDGQIKHYEAKLVEAENKLKDFKSRNFGVSGLSDKDYFSHVSTLSEEVDKLRIDLSAAERARESYRRELAAENPQLPRGSAAKNAPVDMPMDEDRLVALQRRLEELLTMYTEQHPEVISTRRQIATLRAEMKKGGFKIAHAATSPVYQKLRLSLADTEAQVASLQTQLAAKEANLQQVRALAGRAPQVEAELAQLNRDYDVIRKNYEEMVARREAALLGVKLDESSQLTSFRVIEPAHVSRSPAFPARWHWAVIALAFSMAAGVAACLIADLVTPTFDTASELRRFVRRPVLGTVPVLVPSSAEGKRRFAIGHKLVGLMPWMGALSAVLDQTLSYFGRL